MRTIDREELERLPKDLEDWTSGFAESFETRRVILSSAFDRTGCFVAEEKETLVGCVAATNLPRKNWLVVRYLAAKNALSRVYVVEKLLSRALEFVETKKPEFLRATTPATQPFVDVYKSFGFRPLRRDFRVTWDLGQIPGPSKNRLEIKDVTEKMGREIAHVFVESIRPYWEWRIEEQGGEEAVADSFREWVGRGERWIAGSLGGRVVGLSGIIPNYYKSGEGRFRGTFVVPDSRGKGIGRTMMGEVSSLAKKLGQRKMTVYTFSYLDCLAPGALLYIKSGGKIESEYLQLQRIL